MARIEDAYDAKKALSDWNKKANEKESYVDWEKIKKILDTIKEKIEGLEINSKSSFIGYREYNYYGYLSPGEGKVLKDLGYKVQFEDNYDSMHGDYYRISW